MRHNYLKFITKKTFRQTRLINSFIVRLKVFCEDATEVPEIGKPSFQGSARQTFGAGTLRISDDDDEAFNKIHADKQETIRTRNDRRFDDDFPSSTGIVIKTPQSHVAFKPPGINPRYPGKPSNVHSTSINDPLLKPFGTRREEIWPHQRISPNKVFRETIIMEEGELESSNHQSSGTPEECDATCEPMEFFCAKNCFCIHSDMRCGKIIHSSVLSSFMTKKISIQMVKSTADLKRRMN